MSLQSKLLALLVLFVPACQSGSSASPTTFPPPPFGPEAELVDLRQAVENPPEFLRLMLDAQQSVILQASMRASSSLLGAGSFILRPDPNSSGSILEGFCTSVPAQGPPAGLVSSKDGATLRLASWCETAALQAGGVVSGCQLYVNLTHLNGAAFGGAEQGSLWLCAPACASDSECAPLIDSQGVIRCACASAP